MNVSLIKKVTGDIIESHFGRWLDYAFLTGSWVLKSYQIGKSDVDFCIVLKNNVREISKPEL